MAVKQILGKVTVTPKGEYSSGETYKRLDIVTSNGQSYIAKVDNTGVSVTDTNTWLQLVEKPEKGIDYFTEEDIAQLVSMVTDDSESEFNEYYNGKVSDFDSNASSKTSEFNSNYDEKVESFNTIFDTSTDNFDGNYETKLSAFNENASTQTSTFNSVVEQATSDFNSNASTLTETFNTNASEKTSAFNVNATEKTQEFNDNVDEKTEQITSQLDNYVQFDNYATATKAGIIKATNYLSVTSDGVAYASPITQEIYESTNPNVFIAKGTLENIKDYYVESSTPVKNLNNSLRNLTPKQDIEGTDNTFNDGLESPLYALGGDGKSEQVVTTGANLLNLDVDNNNQSYGGMTVIIDKDSQTVNFDGSLSDNPDGGFSSFNRQFPLKEPITVEAGSYDFFAKAISGSGTASGAEGRMRSIKLIDTDEKQYEIGSNKGSIEINKASFTFEQPVTITTIQIIIYSNMSLNNYKIGLYFGKQNVEYEPYTGGQPSPSPDYPQEINSIEGSVEFIGYGGINICPTNFADWESGEYNTSGDKANNDFRLRLKNLIYCRSNTDFYFNLNNTTGESYNFLVRGYDNNKSFVKNYGIVGTGSITVDKGTAYLSITIGDVDGTTTYDDYMTAFNNNKLQPFVCFGGIENKTYEPYIEPNEVTFNLNEEKLRSVGDVKDELVVDLDTGDYYKVENVGEVVFDGSDDEKWKLDAITGGTEIRQFSNLIGNVLYKNDGIVRVTSNYFKGVIWNLSWTFNNTITAYIYGNLSGVRLQSDKFEDVEQLKQWLSTNNTIVDYVLQTPTTKKLGTLLTEDLAKLKTFKGYNNVTVNTNLGLMNIRFTYGLDIKKYVDNKIAQLSEQLIKGE